MDYSCTEAECVSSIFFMCWKCALSKELLHPGPAHVLSTTGEEIQLRNGSLNTGTASTQDEEEYESDDDEEDEGEGLESGDDEAEPLDAAASDDGL